ncbi:GCN5-related N-acetyltransferase [Cytidiella melzeri]|nr:GCN5-related N-acetyltransferase [Cytidiella melzeri]
MLIFSVPDVIYTRISAEETIPLRHSVLWPDQPVSYVLLPEDASGFHYGAIMRTTDEAIECSTPVAVISLFKEALPATTDSQTPSQPAARFRKFACEPAQQGHGIGTGLLRHVFEVAKHELDCSVIWCDARMKTAAWYERRGMQRFGDVFYKGPIEYVRMKIDLS